MTEHKHSDELPRLHALQQRVSIITWIVVCLLSVRGLFAFYGMKEKSWVEQLIHLITDPIVSIFSFSSLEASNIPGITVGLAAVSLLIISYFVQLAARMYYQRTTKLQSTISFRHTLISK